jgi:hypothetical protein
MMQLLTFFALSFGLFGVFIAQYKAVYKAVYQLWTAEIVHNPNSLTSESQPANEKKRCKVCSEVETYCREVCDLTNALTVLFLVVFITGILALCAATVSLRTVAEPGDIVIIRCVQALIFIIFFSLASILKITHIDIIHKKNTSQIDQKLFHIWCKMNCHESKQSFQQNLQPPRMYVILNHKIKEYLSKKELDTKLGEEDTDETTVPMNWLSLFNRKSVNNPCPSKYEDAYTEQIIWNFIDNIHKNPQKWDCLIDQLKGTTESKNWNRIKQGLGDIDKDFVRYLIIGCLLVILIVFGMVIYPEFETPILFNSTIE